MTGLNPEVDKIIEVAAIATDWNFVEFGAIETVVHQPPEVLAAMDEWCTVQHGESGLTARVEKSKINEKQAEKMLLDFIAVNFSQEEKIILAGNSIHQDRKFIDESLPKLAEKLHYRMLDVSAWKVVFNGKFNKKFAKLDNHRALEDIRGSIEELQYYLRRVNAEK
jgi:oligoribonuclease